MRKQAGQKNWMRMLAAVLLALVCATGAVAQQAPQPLVVYSNYTIKPGEEADFLEVVNKVGAPVRDKLMKEGVVLAWGVEVLLIRGAWGGGTTHSIWYAVPDWAGVEKVQMGIAAQIQKIGADEAKAAEEAKKKNQRPAMGTMERANEAWDASKTRDW